MILLPLLLSLLAASPTAPRATPQTLVVTAPGWDADRGQATLIAGDRVLFGPAPVHLGARGLAWGLGLRRRPGRTDGPDKREGDRRSPAGIFAIGTRYHRDGAAHTFCVDDAASQQYNTIVRLETGSKPTWNSAEHMREYRVAVVVEHNAARIPGRGSCIFLHESDRATAGCTALAPRDLDQLLARLAPGARLVQLPEAAYRELAAPWNLPSPALVGLAPHDDEE
ncbi:MAG: hypothetical protein CVU56_12600 [Deltaproteobacteria bacterium HGW-Deltaproteobacteria-14]|nr:MAG: hypothetical protein CVU56_12600 [Deltaproteobacteria bacterium HGW-Deltaproteobacteria-14]